MRWLLLGKHHVGGDVKLNAGDVLKVRLFKKPMEPTRVLMGKQRDHLRVGLELVLGRPKVHLVRLTLNQALG